MKTRIVYTQKQILNALRNIKMHQFQKGLVGCHTSFLPWFLKQARLLLNRAASQRMWMYSSRSAAAAQMSCFAAVISSSRCRQRLQRPSALPASTSTCTLSSSLLVQCPYVTTTPQSGFKWLKVSHTILAKTRQKQIDSSLFDVISRIFPEQNSSAKTSSLACVDVDMQIVLVFIGVKPQRKKKGRNLFEMPTKNYVFFSAARYKKDIIFGGHLKQISTLLISLGLQVHRVSNTDDHKTRLSCYSFSVVMNWQINKKYQCFASAYNIYGAK